MKILYINTYIPYPLNSGGNQAFFMMADYIRKHHDLSVLLYVHNSKEQEFIEELRKLWDNVTFYIYKDKGDTREMDETSFSLMSWKDRLTCILLNSIQKSFKRKIRRKSRKTYLKSLLSLINNDPAEAPLDFVRYNSTLYLNTEDLTPSFCDYVKNVSAQGFDIIQVEFYEYLPLVYMLPKDTKKVFVHHEIRFVRNENEYSYFTKKLSTDRLLLEKEKAEELHTLSYYDAIVTLTEIDKNILCQNHIPEEKIFVSPAITQTVEYVHKPFKPAKELIFIGSGNHFPNSDALLWFCQKVMTNLKSSNVALPVIHVTGKWHPVLASSLKKLCPSIHFTGIIEDLQTFLNGKISIVPIRIGSGMRMKILDSIFAAAPIITTSKGCEGLPMRNGENCLIADTAEDFAKAIARVLSDVGLQEKLALNAQNSKNNMINERELFEKRLSVYNSLTHKEF